MMLDIFDAYIPGRDAFFVEERFVEDLLPDFPFSEASFPEDLLPDFPFSEASFPEDLLLENLCFGRLLLFKKKNIPQITRITASPIPAKK